MRHALALLLALTLLPAAALAAELPVPEIPYKKFVLGNGLTLLVHEDHKAPIVAVNVWYHVGSKNEKPGKTGFAHLFEHLMFNGSENFNDDYFKVLEQIGATDLNGTTNEDRTNYFQNVPLSALDTVLWLESDRMGHLLGAIDQAKLDEQRGVVQNEKRQGENQPYGRRRRADHQGASTRRATPTPGRSSARWRTSDAASLDDVKEWFRTYYGPSNAVLVVAGDIDAEDAQAKVETVLRRHPAGAAGGAASRPGSRKRTGTQRQVLQDRVPQARIYKVWNIPRVGRREDDALDLVAERPRLGQELAPLQAAGLRRPDRHRRRRLAGHAEIGSQFIDPGHGAARRRPRRGREGDRRGAGALPRRGPDRGRARARAKTERLAGFIRGVERIGGFGGKSDILARARCSAATRTPTRRS